MTSRYTRSAEAADRLYLALRAAETGNNSFGPTWNTAKMVAALREFYERMQNVTDDEA
jgi:hypothetical protein